MSESPDSQVNDPIFDKQWEDSEERSTAVTSNTPSSELSPPDSPITKTAGLNKIDSRAKSRSLAASLSLEEQVIYISRPLYNYPLITLGITLMCLRFLEIPIDTLERDTRIQNIRWA